MAVLIRENRVIDNTEFKDVRIFKSDKLPVTSQDEKKALELDKFIANFFALLKRETINNELFNLKNKNGVIKLWYYIGSKLDFVDNPEIVIPSDKKYIWKALWYHAGDLAPGEMKSRAGTNRDHFLYCYRLAKYEKDFVLTAGNWRAWGDFFDSPILSRVEVLNWFEKKIPEIKKLNLKNWLRDFIKLIRNEYQNKDMSFLLSKEIHEKLDTIFSDFISKSK